MASVSGTYNVDELVMLSMNPAAYNAIKDLLPPGQNVQVFSQGEKTIAALMDAGLINGVRSASAPSHAYGKFWLKPAELGSATLPDIDSDAELKQSDGGNWVEPFTPIGNALIFNSLFTGNGTQSSPIALDVSGFDDDDLLIFKVVNGAAQLVKLDCDPCGDAPTPPSGGSGSLI